MIREPLRVLVQALRDGRVTAAALVDEANACHRASESTLGAYKAWSPDVARAQAVAADALFAAGIDLGPLQGIPVSVKDLYGVEGLPVFAGAKRPLPPAFGREGAVVRSLRRQAAVMTGKTHTVEFAFGGIGRNTHWGTPRNPWDAHVHRVSGGSSSGAGVSLVQGTAVLALGTDTAGSVRVPASWTGTVGLKTTKGRWPTDGIVPLSPLHDTPGLLGRTVEDVAIAALALEGGIPGLRDGEPTELPRASVRTLRIGVPKGLLWDGCAPGVGEAVQSAVEELARAGAQIGGLELPEAEGAWAVFLDGGTSAAELFTFLEEALPERLDELDPIVASRILAGKEIPATRLLARQRRLEHLAAACVRHFDAFDVLLCPTVPIPPPKLEEVEALEDYRARNMACLRNTAVVSYLGLCALTMPVGLDALGLPVGLQLIAAGGSDRRLLAIGRAVERAIGDGGARLGRAPLQPP